jgi:hypothetical protein
MAAVLNSWKEIATYLRRGVRTVQRWELEKDLPVHRIGEGRKAPVFAFEAELRAWLEGDALRHDAADTASTLPPSLVESTGARKPICRPEPHEKQRILGRHQVKYAALLMSINNVEKRLQSQTKVSRPALGSSPEDLSA